MNTIIDIRIAPTERAAVTPCELLEDFADCTPSWHYLEEESAHYTSLKGVSACVLRQIVFQPYQVLDYAFSACSPEEGSMMRLVLVDLESPQAAFGHTQRHDVVARFVDAFGSYLHRRTGHVTIDVVEEKLEASVA